MSSSDIYNVYGDFLSGRKLDVGRRFRDLSSPTSVNRIDYLHQICRGKKVLHIGCLDHPEILLKRLEDGTWLHGILSKVSDFCLGIDVNKSGCDYVQRELGVRNIQLLDLSKPVDSSEISRLRRLAWDLILCPEVLEHITNHQQFLDNVWQISNRGTSLITTVPNAFAFENFVNAFRRFESVNSDHRYSFTFYTLSRLLAAHGWNTSRIIYYSNPKNKLWLRLMCQLSVCRSRVFSDGIIIEARPSKAFSQ